MVQKIRSDVATSYSILGLNILIGLCGLLIIISITIESFIGWVGRKNEKRDYQQLEWMSNNTLQLQRFAHEELGCGTWIEEDIPITTALENLAVLDISEPSHPRLMNPATAQTSMAMANTSSPVEVDALPPLMGTSSLVGDASSPLTDASSLVVDASSPTAIASSPTAITSSPTAIASSPTADATSHIAASYSPTADAFPYTANAFVATMNVSPPFMDAPPLLADLSSPIANHSSSMGNASPPLMDISLFSADPSSTSADVSSPTLYAITPLVEEASPSPSASLEITSSQQSSNSPILDTRR